MQLYLKKLPKISKKLPKNGSIEFYIKYVTFLLRQALYKRLRKNAYASSLGPIYHQ